MAEFPLWFMCDYALEEMEQYIGWAPADLLEIFTTNTVQVISSVLLLKANQLSILQTSLIGGILSNILMLLGLSFLIGGVNNHEQHFIRTGAQGASSLLSIAATSLLIPTSVKLLKQGTPKGLVLQSRGVAFVLLLVYITYTICQMGTHRDEYNNLGKQGKGAASQQGTPRPQPPENGIELAVIVSGTQTAQMPIGQAMMRPSSNPSPNPSEPNHPESIDQKSDNQIRGPHLNFWVATTVFSVTIVLLFFCISATVDSISVLMEQRNLSPTFVALILLPIPNCDFAPISLAVDDLLEETMKYTVGRSIQTALLVEPMVVLLSWWMGVPGVTLAFDGFEVVSLFTTILLLNFLVIDAKVHWVHGVLLLADWVLIGIAAYFVRPEAST
jgi:Ca2+:H+ antiporter